MSSLPSPLIDVLSEESFHESHLPGAVNFCVYETAFLDKIRAAFPDSDQSLSVYGLNDTTLEAIVAAEKLKEAGYRNVSVLPGGLEGWKAGGGEVEGGGPENRAISGRYALDIEASLIHWTGRNLFNFHAGTVRLASGYVVMKDGRLSEGAFGVDMTSLACSDLSESTMNKMLIGHLWSEDFFAIEENPRAKFVLSEAKFLEDATDGMPNYRIEGEFIVRGMSETVEFPALVAERKEGGFVAQALLDIDRTLFGSIYGSGKFFARLGQHVVNDLVHLQLKLVTSSQPD